MKATSSRSASKSVHSHGAITARNSGSLKSLFWSFPRSGRLDRTSCSERSPLRVLGHQERTFGTKVSRQTADLVRQRDWPSFVAAFFYPTSMRDSYLTLRAYNIELASVSDETTTSSAGFLKLQWWRQALHSALQVSSLLATGTPRYGCQHIDLYSIELPGVAS